MKEKHVLSFIYEYRNGSLTLQVGSSQIEHNLAELSCMSTTHIEPEVNKRTCCESATKMFTCNYTLHH